MASKRHNPFRTPFPGVSRDLFDGINDDQILPEYSAILPNVFELRLRQFDYLINGADNLEVEFLINRRQATRFLRGDTKGTIEISF